MPWRQTRFVEGEYYHVYNRGVNRQKIFFEAANYQFFLRRLRKYLLPNEAVIIAYCLMPNHYHLLVRTQSPRFSEAMQAFGTSYSKAINKRFHRVGPLFQSRFRAIHVEDESYLLHLSRYIHLNPLQANLVTVLEKWEYSSYLEYSGQRQGTLPDPDVILAEFPSREAYVKFVLSAAPCADVVRHLLFEE